MSATVDFFVSTKAGDLKTRLLKRLKVVKFDVNFVTFSISSPTIFRFSLKAMTVRHWASEATSQCPQWSGWASWPRPRPQTRSGRRAARWKASQTARSRITRMTSPNLGNRRSRSRLWRRKQIQKTPPDGQQRKLRKWSVFYTVDTIFENATNVLKLFFDLWSILRVGHDS